MNPQILSAGIAVLLAFLAGCQKKVETAAAPLPPKPMTVAVVKASERSRSFLAVNRELELGGTMYGYVDVDGDVLKAAGNLKGLLTQLATVQPALAPFAQKDYAAVAEKLGLTDIKAVGFSSVPDGTGFFRNRVFVYAPEPRHGLLLGLGRQPGPFAHLNLAPADAAFFAESQVDVPVVYRTIKDVVSQLAGEPAGNQLEQRLRQAGEGAAFSVLDLLDRMKGHAAIVVRVDPKQAIALPAPKPISIPSFSLLLCVDGVAPAVEPALAKSPLFRRTDQGTEHVYAMAHPLPVASWQPVIVADGTTLYVATSRAFLDECRGLKSGLAQTAAFREAVAHVGSEGNGIAYIAPAFFNAFRRVETLNPSLPPQVKMALGKVPTMDRPLVALRTNLPDGILVRSYLNRSLKQDLAMATVYNPVTVGLMAAMAIPAFQRVRAASQEKAVLNNLRMLSSAADQYYLEHGTTTVTFDELVGPGKYIKRIVPVAGENYHALRFVQGRPLQIRLPNGRTVRY